MMMMMMMAIFYILFEAIVNIYLLIVILNNWSKEHSPSWQTYSRLVSPEIPSLMGGGHGSYPCTQQSATEPYHEPD
jgi:hypothetical protein